MTDRTRRRRGEALESAILDAAWAEITEHGWSGFTISGVARRCGTAKAVIYRRWGDRRDLARQLLVRALGDREPAVASSGSLRADLIRFVEDMQNFYSGPFGEVVRGVLSEQDPGSSALAPHLLPIGLELAIEAAMSRGELHAMPSTLSRSVGPALLTAELMHTSTRLGDDLVQHLVDDIWLPALRRTSNFDGLGR